MSPALFSRNPRTMRNEPNGAPRDGCFEVVVDDLARSEQEYLTNTAILVTRLYDSNGGAIEITDFAPRFGQYGRAFRPMMIIRMVRPIAGHPRIRIRLRPYCLSEYMPSAW